MKTVFLFAVLFLGSATHANSYRSFSCKGNEGYGTSSNLVMTLTAIDRSFVDVQEGDAVEYHLVIKNSDDVWADTNVEVSNVDVILNFKDATKKVFGRLYLDEPDQSRLHVIDNGFNMDCR
jgi:hypothetical protein